MSDLPSPASKLPADRQIVGLMCLFGGLYFIQGVIEPTAGLVSQPIQTQLEDWKLSAARIGQILWLVAIPWSLKPVFGLFSDFMPLFGARRKSYLLLSTGLAYLAFHWLALGWAGDNGLGHAPWLLLAATAGVAMTDVVVDALSVETSQPRGLTGQFQSIQWGAMSAATILTGSLGGYVAAHRQLRPAFLLCAALAFLSLLTVLFVVREPKADPNPAHNLRLAYRELAAGRRLVLLASVAMFLLLWNFNPFSTNVQQHYVTRELHLGEQFYGHLISIQALAQIVACAVYGWICRRIPFGWLVHGSIVLGILSTVCYWGMSGYWSAVGASIAFGLTYQLASLIQLDLAARTCPTASAGTVFALLMAVSNTGMSLGIYLGGSWYDALTAHFHGNRHLAFDLLVAIGAACTAGCWLVVPIMRWADNLKSEI
jgi:MFS family permease